MLSELRVSTRRFALEFASVKDEANGNAEERSEQRRPDHDPPLARDGTEDVEDRAGAAAEGRRERHEREEADDGPPLRHPTLGLLERDAPSFRLA